MTEEIEIQKSKAAAELYEKLNALRDRSGSEDDTTLYEAGIILQRMASQQQA